MNTAPADVELPEPCIDMEGDTAAAWLESVAELYSGVDRWHVRRLAASLREPPKEPVPEAERVTIDELRSLKSELSSASCDAHDAAARLDDAEDAVREAIKRMEPKS